jgi:hypothetical protein
MKQFTIPSFRLEQAQKIASKHNVQLVVGEESYNEKIDTKFVTISVELPQSENVPVLVAYAHVNGERYTFTNDWTWTEENINSIVYSRCDRCQADHHRVKVFIVKVAGQLLQVGGHCAAELDCELKMNQLLKLRSRIEEELKDEEDCYCRGCGCDYVNVDDYLKAAAVIVKHSGYVSKKTAELDLNKTSTVDEVFDVIAEHDQTLHNNWKKLVEETLTSEEKQQGYWTKKCMEYLNAQEFSEYIHNCKVAILSGKVKLMGFAISVVGQIIKVEREATAKFVRSLVPSKDEKIQVSGKIIRMLEGVGYMGESTTKVTIDDQNYGKVWFQTTAQWINSAKEGDTIKCNINVKEVKDNIIFAKRASKIQLNDVAVK